MNQSVKIGLTVCTREIRTSRVIITLIAISLPLLILLTGCQTTGDPDCWGAFCWEEQKAIKRIECLKCKRDRAHGEYHRAKHEGQRLNEEYDHLVAESERVELNTAYEKQMILKLKDEIKIIKQENQILENNLHVLKLTLMDKEDEYKLWVFRKTDNTPFYPSEAISGVKGGYQERVSTLFYTDHPKWVKTLAELTAGFGSGFFPFGSNIADAIGLNSKAFEVGEKIGVCASFLQPFRNRNVLKVGVGLLKAAFFYIVSDGISKINTR